MNTQKLISIKEAVDMFGLPHATWLRACRERKIDGAINYRGRAGWRIPIPSAQAFTTAEIKEKANDDDPK